MPVTALLFKKQKHNSKPDPYSLIFSKSRQSQLFVLYMRMFFLVNGKVKIIVTAKIRKIIVKNKALEI